MARADIDFNSNLKLKINKKKQKHKLNFGSIESSRVDSCFRDVVI